MSDLVSKVHSFEREKCGIILTTGELIELTNIHPKPTNNFAMSNEELEAYPLDDILAFWHSHREYDSNLSSPDYLSFLRYPKHLHIIFCYTHFTLYNVRNNLVIRLAHESNAEFSSRFKEFIS